MESTKPKGNTPQFAGDGIAVWVNEVREGQNKGDKYLSVQLLGKNGIKLNAFKVKPRPEKVPNMQPFDQRDPYTGQEVL